MTGDPRRLRCVTLNVLGPANPGWDRRRVVIGNALRGLDADVVALQEVRTEHVEELLGPGYQVTPFSATSEDGTGGVLATRAPHRRSTSAPPNTARTCRGAPR